MHVKAHHCLVRVCVYIYAKCWTGNGRILNRITQKRKQARAPRSHLCEYNSGCHAESSHYDYLPSAIWKMQVKSIGKYKLHELDTAWPDLVWSSHGEYLAGPNAIARWSSASGMSCEPARGSRRFSMLNLSQCDHTWSSLQNDGERAKRGRKREKEREWESEKEREIGRRKRMERKGAGTLRRYFQFDLWSKPLMPAYSLAWKRIPKRYLNFPNAPRKRAKCRTISLPPLGEYFFPPLTKSWQWLSIAKRITSRWEIRYRNCLFRKQRDVESSCSTSSKQVTHISEIDLTFDFWKKKKR